MFLQSISAYQKIAYFITVLGGGVRRTILRKNLRVSTCDVKLLKPSSSEVWICYLLQRQRRCLNDDKVYEMNAPVLLVRAATSD